MRERAHLAGGWLTAGPDGEHFRVTVFIPFGTREAGPVDASAGGEAGGSIPEIAEAKPALAGVGLPRSEAAERGAGKRG